jgi:hypothetical protein
LAISAFRIWIKEHCEKLRELAAQADPVVEFGMRHGVSTVATRQHRLLRYGASRPVKTRIIRNRRACALPLKL